MKITLDHNCIIDLAQKNDIGFMIRSIIDNPQNSCFVVNIGASEMQQFGVQPSRYDKFVDLLKEAEIDYLQRLNPMMIWDVTFWDLGIWGSEEDILLANKIEHILFGNSRLIDIAKVGLVSKDGRIWVNRLCDTHTIWSHIYYENDIFLTSDQNFLKETKKESLIKLGAKKISNPKEFLLQF